MPDHHIIEVCPSTAFTTKITKVNISTSKVAVADVGVTDAAVLGKLCEIADPAPPLGDPRCIFSDTKFWTLRDDPLCRTFSSVLEIFSDGTKTFTATDPNGVSYPDMETLMSDAEFAVPTGTTELCSEAQVDVVLSGVFAGTAADVLALATLPDFDFNGTVVAATVDDIQSWSVKVLPCEAVWLTDPQDPTTANTVTADGTFVSGVQVRGDADAALGGASLTAEVAQIADGESRWCFTFKSCVKIDKAGTIAASK